MNLILNEEKNIKISVIIPNYNHAKFLKRRIESVLNQTYRNFEVIILDDYSQDESKQIIELYRENEKVTHIVFNQSNSGSTFKQWKSGFDLATGDFIWIAESDDFSDINFLKTLVEKIKKNPSIILAYTNSYLVDSLGVKIKKENDYLRLIKKIKGFSIVNGKSFIKQNMLIGNAISNASSAIFKKSVLNKIDSSYLSYKASGDRLFWIEIAEQGDVLYIPEKLNYFRQHLDKVSPNAMKNGSVFFEAIKTYKLLKEKGYINQITKSFVLGFYIWTVENFNEYNGTKIKTDVINQWKELTRYPKLDILFYLLFYRIYNKVRHFLL